MAARGNIINRTTIANGNLGLAAGTGDTTNCTAVDLIDYDGCVFNVVFGAITANAVTSVHLEESSDNTTFTDIDGTNTTIADDEDNQVIRIELARKNERYARAVIVRATANAVVHYAWSEPYNAGVEPVTQHTDVANTEIHVSPASGGTI